MKPSKLEIERDRLAKFAKLLDARSRLLNASFGLDCVRPTKDERLVTFWGEVLYSMLDAVWAAQQACIEYELKYPLER